MTSQESELLGKVVLLTYEDGKGTGPRLVQSLNATSSSWKRVVYPLELPLPDSDSKVKVAAVGEIVNFIDSTGATQVSVVSLVQKIPTSTSTQVAHGVFELILSKAPVQGPSFTVIIPASTVIQGSLHHLLLSSKKPLLAAFFNGASESKLGVLAGFPRLPGTTRIQEEFLAVLLHFVHVMGLPTVVLLGPHIHGPLNSKNESMQVINRLGSTLAEQLGLAFSEDASNAESVGTELSPLDDWRSLYT